MGVTYTNNLYFANPDAGECNWDDDWYRNQFIKDLICTALLSSNRVVSGGETVATGPTTVEVSEGNGTFEGDGLSWINAQLDVVVAPPGENVLTNYIYFDSTTEAIKVSMVPPSRPFLPIAVVDCDEIDIIRVIDVRPMQAVADPNQAVTKIILGSNIVDVVLYDTTKDADGGAWRYQTQLTSWYNEELNTATRGSRKEFPEVALIVAEINKVTIYDATLVDVPMWMVFNGGVYNAVWGDANRPNSCVVMLKGVMSVGTIGASTWFSSINFIEDNWESRTEALHWIFNDGIATRNSTAPNYSDGSGYLAGRIINDVAMTTIAGTAYPTIAVATDGGVSVIDGPAGKGTVVDITWTSEGGVFSISFDDGDILITNGSGDGIYYKRYELPTSDLSEPNGYQKGTAKALHFPIYSAIQALAHDLNYLAPLDFLTNTILEKGKALGNIRGLTLLKEDTITPANGMVNYITSAYQSGWMQGDIKLATLADSVEGPIGTDIETEHVTNGTFDTDTSGWDSFQDGVLSVDAGRLKVQNSATGGSSGAATQNIIALTPGQVYTVSVDMDPGDSGVVGFRAGTAQGGASFGEYSNTIAETVTFTFKATTGNVVLSLYTFNTTADKFVYFDNITVKANQNLVENGEFSRDDVWTLNNIWTIASGVATYDENTLGYMFQDAFEAGKTYLVSCEVVTNTGNVSLNNYNGGYQQIVTTTGTGTLSGVVSITSGDLGRFYIGADTSGTVIDNVVVEELDLPDRSYNNNPLQVVGELNRTLINAASDIVAFSGFTTNNYIEQPYNSDLDFGTGDFCIMGWFNTTTTGAVRPVLERIGSTTRLLVRTHTDESLQAYFQSDNGQFLNVYSSETVTGAGWVFFTAKKEGDTVSLSVNAGEPSSTTNPSIDTFTELDAILRIGRTSTGTSWGGSLALIRLSASVPTAAQIAEIYNTEKHLFSGNKGLLSGGDNVTALSYDGDSNSLLVTNDDGTGNQNLDIFVGNIQYQNTLLLAPGVAVDHNRDRQAVADPDRVTYNKFKTS